ncbi:uncharacterized protein L203_104071 [Cryptococcus depauperatus CBS 7841]|uniref:Store-operated calcium entry-associated regulatory factor n=1 Tax=Cryptococcus depauperatus CBS 7841 TaxID=1295531 RepID=A0AAJ8JV02_9TREE
MLKAKKISLSSIKTLTFYADKLTASRRTSPIPQLTCQGPGCKIFQPDVVQCLNMGDDGLGNIQWKCDTDLPSSLRMGQVGVSCEGWSKAGDTDVLQGSCGLTYHLYKVNRGAEYDDYNPYHYSSTSRYDKWFAQLFNIAFYTILFILFYSLARSLIARYWPRYTPPPLSRYNPFGPGDGPGGGSGGGGGGGSGWWPGGGPGDGGGPGTAPPPYSKRQPNDEAQWRPGFWTGLATGGLAAYLANNRRRQAEHYHGAEGWNNGFGYGRLGGWGWGGRERLGAPPVETRGIRRRAVDDDGWDRMVGPSRGGGEMRRATGFGGTSTR